ncbi:hypothetical protein HY641_03135 [Candidatus Woesearchaeota archaeon]|nr:hypothetical protein [Candidatus Woesearchaeota archaeon]
MKRTTCEECGGKIINKKVDYMLLGQSLGKFDAQVCTTCGEVCYEEEVSKEMTRIAKEKGLWGLSATTKVGQTGDSLDVRLSKRIVDFVGIKKGTEVTIQPVNKHKIEITF